jgi:hypothetical protein
MAAPSRAGYVYAVLDPGRNAVKIGCAALNDGRRQRYWQAGNWNAGKLWVHSESLHENRFEAEDAAHARLAHARLHGWGPRYEWFHLSDAEVRRWLAEREVMDVPLVTRIRDLGPAPRGRKATPA